MPNRFRGQEGAGDDAPMHSHLGILGVTGFLMQDLKANPLDYVEGGALDARRWQISEWLDSTNPDLSAFYKRGGKLIVVIGTNDTLASPGAQLDFYQSVIEKMGRERVDVFARFFVLPQANLDVGHGGTYSEPNGGGFGIVAVAWLKWQLEGDENAGKMFSGPSCGLCDDTEWKFEKKKIP